MVEFVTAWLLVALLTEGITEIIKALFSEKIKDKATFATSIVVGVVLAFAFGLNPFGLTGAAAYVSTVAAGLLASRGANYLHDFLKRVGVLKPLD
jgi:hypothetical protein